MKSLLSSVVFLAALLFACQASPAQVNPFDASKFPQQQIKFCRIFSDLDAAQISYSHLTDLQKAQTVKPDASQTNKHIIDLLGPSLSFSNWRGAINTGRVGNGSVQLSFTISCPNHQPMFEFVTAFTPTPPPAFPGAGMVPFSNSVVQEVTKTGKGFPAIVSGNFYRATNRPDIDIADPVSFQTASLWQTARCLASFSKVDHIQ